MIDIKKTEDCCGCYSCVQRCPKHCIEMIEDSEGFDYPKVNISSCINCGICESVCPQLNILPVKQPSSCYAIKHYSKQIQLKSSSGGAFSLFAEYILKNNGVVFGAAFDKNWNVVHKYIEHIEKLDELQMSKYVQSIIGNTFKEAQNFLKANRMVLFVGTPCQIHGLKLFLKKDYENLFTIDFVCHGVPSRKVWQKYLQESITYKIKKQLHLSSSYLTRSKSKDYIQNIQFRDKRLNWETYSFSLQLKFTKSGKNDEKNLNHPSVEIIEGSINETLHKNPYLRGFIHDLYLRPSCYTCKNKGFSSESDITLADFWGIKETYPHLFDKNGVSCLTVNSAQGKTLLSKIKVEKTQVNFEDALRFNPSFVNSVKRPPFRKYFFKLMEQIPFKALVLFGQGYNKILRILKFY